MPLNMDTVVNPNTAPIRARIPCAFNQDRFIVGKPLTDSAINKYAKDGWYSEAFRQKRKEVQQRKLKRTGNFILGNDGRLIFSPI